MLILVFTFFWMMRLDPEDFQLLLLLDSICLLLLTATFAYNVIAIIQFVNANLLEATSRVTHFT